jgi:folate-dependent phosphoribosylglycinamide formyltransferase PurN
MTLKLAWFATGSGTTSPALLSAALDAIASGRLDARIAVVFCNREVGEDAMSDAYCERVEAAGIPLVRFSDRRFRREHGGRIARKGESLPAWRQDYDREVMRLLESFDFELGMLAGYKLIFCEEAAAKWDLLNLHPAAPGGPAGVWQDVIRQLIETRAERAGVMTHLATPELDEGPVVSYCTYPIRGDEMIDAMWADIEAGGLPVAREVGEDNALFREIRRRGVLRELPLVIETLRAFADGRVRVVDKQPVDAEDNSIAGYDLTREIEAAVSSML